MSNPKSYVEKREQWFRAGAIAGDDIGTQRTGDYLAIVLNDPKIMGKDTFGAGRITKVYEAIHALEAQYNKAFQKGPEQDYYQDKLDERLRRIFGTKGFVPFAQRFPNVKQPKYGKG